MFTGWCEGGELVTHTAVEAESSNRSDDCLVCGYTLGQRLACPECGHAEGAGFSPSLRADAHRRLRMLRGIGVAWPRVLALSWAVGILLSASAGPRHWLIDAGVIIFAFGTAAPAIYLVCMPLTALVLRENDPQNVRRPVILSRALASISGSILLLQCIQLALVMGKRGPILDSVTQHVLFAVFALGAVGACWLAVKALPRSRATLARMLGQTCTLPEIHPIRRGWFIALSVCIMLAAIIPGLPSTSMLLGPVFILWLTTATIRSSLSPLDPLEAPQQARPVD